jgi:hypothetical protein
MQKINHLLDRLSEYFAHRKGLLPVVGILFVCLNLILQLIPGVGWLASSHLFLHVGVIIAILGTMLAWVL